MKDSKINFSAKAYSAIHFFVLVLVLASSNMAFAQVTASITGRVEDPSGAAIPNANVTITSLETGVARTITANEVGNYQVLALPVGRYEVKAEISGFKAAVQTGIDLVVGQQAVVNLRLEVGTTQEQVTVTSDAQLVNTTTSSIAGLVGEQQVKDLPINGRSFDLLITLNPGTVNDTSAKSGAAGSLMSGGNLFSVAGRRPIENLTILNGVQYSGAGSSIDTPGGASGLLLGVDAIREYNVVSDDYGAEYGQRAGAQVSLVTQSGTNQLHGTLFEFLRNSDLDARNFFDHTIGAPPFKRNQFGGALGGPIRKDKAFVFGNYEGFREHLALSDITIVPDLNARQGLLPNANGVPTPVANLDTRMLPFMALWPLPNGPDLGGGVAETFSNPLQMVREDFGTARFDQVFSNKDTLNAVYTISDGTNVSPQADPLFAIAWDIRNQVISTQETHIFSPHVINTITAGFSRGNFQAVNVTTAPASLSLVEGSITGQFTLGGMSANANVLTPPGFTNPFELFRRNLFTYTDGVQVIKGKHQISFGAWFQRIQQNDNLPNGGAGHPVFTNFTTFLQGNFSSMTVLPSVTPQGWRSWEGAWYFQDTIQLRPNLTVRLGLRHEFSNGWSDAYGRNYNQVFANNGNGQTGTLLTLPTNGSSLDSQNNAKWLFSPRVGLAWDPFGKGETSIRAGGGIYYDMVDWQIYYIDNVPPINGQVTYANESLFSVIPINPSTPISPPCGPGVPKPCEIYSPKGIQSNFYTPTVYEWNFTVEQQLTRGTALRVAYVGNHTYHQWTNIDPNTVLSQICSNSAGCVAGGINAATSIVPQGERYIPAVGTRPNPYLGSGFYSLTNGYGNYNALQTEVKQRLTRGLQFRANYTWSKNLDIGSGVGMDTAGGGTVDRSYPNQDYGPAGFNVTSQASGTLSYQLPFGQGRTLLNSVHGAADKLVSGWQFNTIVTLLTGFPQNITVGAASGDGNTGNPNRPNWNPAFTGNVITGSPNQWFNPNAFSIPASGTFGDVQRNALRGPGEAVVDVSLFKVTKISERIGLQFRAEVFNSLNKANFSGGGGSVFSGTSINPTAGLITATTTTSRQIQFGLKLVF